MIWAVVYALLSVINAFWLRRHSRLAQRVNDVNWDAVVLVDIVAGFLVFSTTYLLGIMVERPEAGETISSFAGRYAAQGRGWAEGLTNVIDVAFLVLTSENDHCAKAYAKRWKGASQ